MANGGRSHNFPSPSMPELRSKLKRIVRRHEQMKIAFHQLKTHINIGLLEAEGVFASLSIPLMKLVGLKTVEMAEEGRFSTVFMATDSPQACRRNGVGSGTPARSLSAVEGADQNHQIPKLEEESYATKATMAGKELFKKQRLQLTQLIHLLRQIETQVDSRQNNIIRTVADHRVSLHKFFNRAISYVSAIHSSSQNHDTFLITLKILRATFDHVGAALVSVEECVEDLMHELAEQMCNPMVEYVKDLKAEMKTGTCAHLVAMVEVMEGAMRGAGLELEELRKEVRVAEERKAFSRLRESEERIRRMEYIGFFLEAKKGPRNLLFHTSS